MDSAVEMIGVGEGLVHQEVAFKSRQDRSMSLSSGAYFGNHSTVSQGRAASAAVEALLVWIGPL